MSVSDEFRAWLSDELNRRGWSHNELARRAGISQVAVSNVLSGHRNAGCNFCVKVALAMDEPPEKLLRLAAILPASSAQSGDVTVTKILDVVRNLTPSQRQEALRYLRFLYQNPQSEEQN